MVVGWILLVVAAILILPCLAIMILRHSEPEWEPRRDMSQHVSNEEFLAACSVKDPKVALGVREVIADCLGIEEQTIHPHDRLVQDLGAW